MELHFDDGVVRTLEFIPGEGGPIFAPLDDPEFFAHVSVDHEAVVWPNELDLDPVVLHGDREAAGTTPFREMSAVAGTTPLTRAPTFPPNW